MKFGALLFVTVSANNQTVVDDDTWVGPKSGSIARLGGDRVLDVSGERRYEDLKNMAKKLWKKKGAPAFDERKYWTYGCHCFLLGDRPMSAMGKGKPVDALDNRCKAYKDCQKCVREQHGEACIGEFVRYTWKWLGKKEDFTSRNDEGSCERDLFECDKQFVHDTFEFKAVFDENFHAFWTKTDFDHTSDESCPNNGGQPVKHMCCGGSDKPWRWIGLNKYQCCNDEVIDKNDQC